MSVLEIPRIYFKGEVAWDPVTTNNYTPDQLAAAYDEADCDATLNAATIGSANVAGFRTAAIDEIVSGGNWNPAGSYRSPFYGVEISGVDLGDGLATADPFVGAPVSFTGMLVDCEPYGAYSSQLFFDDMSFGIHGGCRIFGKRVTRFTDRYINFAANPTNAMIAGRASVVWQTCFDKSAGLEIDAFDSDALKALATSVQEEDVLGVMVRFVTYRTVYYDDPTLTDVPPATAMNAAGQALQAKLRAGGFQPNPARSLLVGTVGLWRRGDAMHEPGDRALLTTGLSIPTAGGNASCGTAWARVGSDRLTLDLSSFLPWADRVPNKVDVGDLQITAADPPPAVAVANLAKILAADCTQQAYEATSGIVDIEIDPGMAKMLAGMDLSISAAVGALAVEAPLRAISFQPNLYADQGGSAETQIQVYDRGVPASAGVLVTLSELGATQATYLSQTTDAAGQVSFQLSTAAGSVTGLVLQPGPNPTLPVTAQAFNTQLYTYMYLRVLPADANIGAMEPTWENVHNYVLSNWEAMAPCMDNWLLLGDEAQVRAYGPAIRKLTDPDNFESYRCMPVTRDLTVGKRQLLYNFLDGGSVSKSLAAPAPPVKEIDFAKLSRAMRNH